MTPEQQRQMFGCEIEPFMQSVDGSITMKLNSHSRAVGLMHVAMSLASDAQEEIARGMHEPARQTLNRIKYLLSKAQEETRR